MMLESGVGWLVAQERHPSVLGGGREANRNLLTELPLRHPQLGAYTEGDMVEMIHDRHTHSMSE